jgi:hypothetical protein
MTMLKRTLISLALVAAAIALAMGGFRGMSDGGLRHSAGELIPAGMSDGGLRPLGMSDGGLSPLGMSDGGL